MTRESFKKLFDLYFEEIRRYIFYRCGDADLADDITQQCFLKVWEKQTVFLPGKEKGLLYKIAGNEFIDHTRRMKLSAKFEAEFSLQDQDSPEDQLAYEETLDLFKNALSMMKENQRVVFLMNRNEGLTYNEIAIRLNLSVKAVEKRMKYALVHLRKELKQE